MCSAILKSSHFISKYRQEHAPNHEYNRTPNAWPARHRHGSGFILNDLPNRAKTLSGSRTRLPLQSYLIASRSSYKKVNRSQGRKNVSLHATMFVKSALATTLAALASSAHATNFTGDVLNGVKVIHDLDLVDVPAQQISRYYLRVGELNGGHPVHIPIMVARGTPESLYSGKKLSLSAAIHGDELNPVRVVQRIFEQLEDQVATLNGTGKFMIFRCIEDWLIEIQSLAFRPSTLWEYT